MTKDIRHQAALWAVLFCCPLVAQEPAADPAGESAAKAPAGLRGWIFPDGGGQLVLQCKAGADEQPRDLATANGEQRITGESYEELLRGSSELQLKSGEKILATAGGGLAEGRQYTAIALREGADWKIRVLADGPAKADSSMRPLRICNFAAGRETVLTVQGGKGVKIPGDSLQELEVAPAVTGLSVKVLATDGGAPAQSSTEVDFTQTPSAYVVVAPDYRGRMRPSVILGGASAVPAEAGEQAAVESQQ
jgi:hypothetical protein